MKAGTLVAMLIWLLATFGLIAWALNTPAVKFYTGGLIIALFIAALFFVFGNAIRQGNKLKAKESPVPVPANTSQQAASDGPQEPQQKENA
jgi:hypothetical protein